MDNIISIITPNYNSSKFLDDCISSVINQTYQNWEMLIVDDKSTDDSREKILELSKNDSRIKHVFLEENVGAAEARNTAISQSKGRYIAFLDSDDKWHPNKLEEQIIFMKNNNIAFSFSNYEVVSEDGREIINLVRVPEKITYSSYLRNTIIGCLTVILDKKAIGDFRMPDLRSSHDMALWLLIMKRGFDAYGLNKNLAQYRLVSTSNTSDKFKAAREVWKVYREQEKLNFIYSLYCFIGYAFNALKKRI